MADAQHFFPFYAVLPPDLLDRAYRSTAGQLAWDRADALRVVALAQRRGYEIIGVATWLPNGPRVIPLIDDWGERRPMTATAFIETFRWEPTDDADRGLKVHFDIWAEPLDVSLQ